VVGRQLTRALRGGTGALIVAVLGGLLLFQAGKANFNAYFVEYYNDYRHAAPNTSDIAKVIRGFGDSVGDTYDAYIFSSPYWIDHRAVSLRLQDMNWNNNLLHVQDAEPHLSEPRNRLYIFRPDNIEAENWILEHYPQGHLMRYQAFIPERDFMVFLSPAQ